MEEMRQHYETVLPTCVQMREETSCRLKENNSEIQSIIKRKENVYLQAGNGCINADKEQDICILTGVAEQFTAKTSV